MSENGISIYELNLVVGEKIKEKETFRHELLNDPKAALEKEFNVKIPENLQVEVHVENANTLHIILPAEDALELTDDQLDQVAGGQAAMNPGNMLLAYGVPGAWNFPKFDWGQTRPDIPFIAPIKPTTPHKIP